jgi:dCTP deaminase
VTNSWDAITPGTLGDGDIRRLAAEGELIISGFEPESVRQACYELRASHIFWDIQSPDENKRIEIDDKNGYLLRPNNYVIAIVEETIKLPSDVLGRILTKGQLFSLGVLPVNTYADPGFRGRLGITLYNASKRYIRFRPGEPVAKIEFTRLPRPVDEPYFGQHGFETEMWPKPAHLYSQPVSDEVGDKYEELEAIYGSPIAEIRRQLDFYSRRVWLQIGITVAGFAAIFALYGHLGLVKSVLVGVIANLATQFAWAWQTRAPRWRAYRKRKLLGKG